MPTKPLVYLSFANPDSHDGGVVELRNQLSRELEIQTGEPGLVTWDWGRTSPGRDWSKKTQEEIRGAAVLVAIVSPSYFRSDSCRKEFEVFRDKEKRTGRRLIFSVYYVEAHELKNVGAGGDDTWADALLERPMVDIRKLRFELDSRQGQSEVAHLAMAIREALTELPPEETLDGGGASQSVARIPEPVYVESLRLKNFRCFKEIALRFDQQSQLEGKWTCIAGINGAGKSSILQALGVAFLGNPTAFQLRDGPLNRMRRRVDLMNWLPAEVEITLRVSGRYRQLRLVLDVDDHGTVSLGGSAPAEWQDLRSSVIVGYGATRNLSSRIDHGNEDLSPDVRRQITLFDPLSQLAGAEVLVAQKRVRGPLIPLFQSLVGVVLDGELKIDRGPDGFVFTLANNDFVGAMDLPDGFRSAAAWMMDLCAVWCEKAPKLAASGNPADIQAIVLIDEIDLHLHPSLQRELVPRLRRALPKVQWIVTTHSPLVLSNFDSAEIIALDRNEPSGVRFLDRQIMGFSANDIYEWLMGTPATGVAMEETLRAAGDDPSKQRAAAELLQTSPFVNDDTAKLSVEQMLARLEHLEK